MKPPLSSNALSSGPVDARRSTEGMVDYDVNSSAQQTIVASQVERIRDLTNRLGRAEPELKIVDYGCGPGMTTIEAVRPAIDVYRSRYADAPIAVCHADQPGNDWNALFALINGPSGYLQGARAVRVEAAVGSFYDQMAAEGSVALATCFAASHWLSRAVRLHAPGAVFFADLEGSARAEMADLARRDWTRFLRCRARELRSGGFLLAVTAGAVADASEPNGIAASGRQLYRALQLVAQEMVDEGLIDRETLDSFVFPEWFMTAAEARAPLETESDLAAAFAIEEIAVAPAPSNPSDIFAQTIADPAAYAGLYTGAIRAIADTTLRAQLFAHGRDGAAGIDRLANDFYRRFERLYRTKPGRYPFELWHLTVLLRRR